VEKPKIVETPDGSITAAGCYQLCKYWAAEDEFDGKHEDAKYWVELGETFLKTLQYSLCGWARHLRITDRLRKEKWKLIPWEERMNHVPRGQF